jgi:hypothetical protein
MSRQPRPAQRPTAQIQTPPEPSAVEREQQAIGQLRLAREGRDRARGGLARAESNVIAAENHRDAMLEAELAGDDPRAADHVAAAVKSLREARDRREAAQARQEAAERFSEKALRRRERVQRECAVELGRAMEDDLDELDKLQSEAVAALRAWHARRSALQGRYARLVPGLVQPVERLDAAAGRTRDKAKVRSEAAPSDSPLDVGVLAAIEVDSPRPWCLHSAYEPGERPTVDVKQPDTGVIFQGDPRYVRYTHPHRQPPGVKAPTPTWPPSHVLDPRRVMRDAVSELARIG